MSPVLIELWGIQIRYYSLMYIIALYLGIYIGQHSAKKYGINPELIKSFGFWVIMSGIIGARAYYIFLRWDYYRENTMEILFVRLFHIITNIGYYLTHLSELKDMLLQGISGLAIHGGIAGAAIGIFIFSKIHKIRFWDLTDIAAPPTLLGQAIGRLGNLMNGETHGVPVFTPLSVLWNGTFAEWWKTYLQNPFKYYPKLVPWGMVFPLNTPAGQEFPNILVHPTMLYETVLNTIGFLILYFYFRKRDLGRGSLSGIYIIMYGVIRMVVSFFRAEDLYFMGLKAPNIASIIFILAGLTILYFANRKKS